MAELARNDELRRRALHVLIGVLKMFGRIGQQAFDNFDTFNLAQKIRMPKRAAELAPTNPEPHYQLALAYRRLGLNDKAVAETAIVKRIHETRRGEATPNSSSAKPNQ